MKGQIVYFRGKAVELTGETEELHGGIFWTGIYSSGPDAGKSVDVADEIVKRVVAPDDPLTRDDVTWEELGRGFIEAEPNWEEGGA